MPSDCVFFFATPCNIPDEGSNQHSLHLKHKVLTTGPGLLGKSRFTFLPRPKLLFPLQDHLHLSLLSSPLCPLNSLVWAPLVSCCYCNTFSFPLAALQADPAPKQCEGLESRLRSQATGTVLALPLLAMWPWANCSNSLCFHLSEGNCIYSVGLLRGCNALLYGKRWNRACTGDVPYYWLSE